MIRALAASLLLLYPVLAGAAARPQDPATPSSQTQTPPPNSTKPKPKKVWTNENLGDAGGTISVVGAPRSASKAESNKPPADKGVDPKTLRSLRDQLQRLEAQLAVVDQQLSDLKDFGKGDAKHAGGLSQNTAIYNSSSVDEQIQQLKDKRTKLQTTIDSLLDAARGAGIEPGQLR
jgi:hypothetical protein